MYTIDIKIYFKILEYLVCDIDKNWNQDSERKKKKLIRTSLMASDF